MFYFTDCKVLCRDCNTVYSFNQISPTRDFSNLQHVALPFFEEHCSRSPQSRCRRTPTIIRRCERLDKASNAPYRLLRPRSELLRVFTRRMQYSARGSSCPLYKQVHSARSSCACRMPCSSQPRLLLLEGWKWRNWG